MPARSQFDDDFPEDVRRALRRHESIFAALGEDGYVRFQFIAGNPPGRPPSVEILYQKTADSESEHVLFLSPSELAGIDDCAGGWLDKLTRRSPSA